MNGEPAPESFIRTCEKMHSAPLSMWRKYEERCTGLVPWNLPGRGIDIPILGTAVGLATQLVPGGQMLAAGAGALGLMGGGSVSNGWDPWVGIGGWGVGVCPAGQRCVGGEVGGVCLGTCVASTPAQPPVPYILPGQPQVPSVPGTQVPVVTGNGGVMGTKICCPSGWHPNKTAYFTRGIRDGGGPRWIPAGTKCVRNRRTNPLNPSALSRAGSRLYQGKQANKWLQKVTIPKRRR
jgi:hypothetical protein